MVRGARVRLEALAHLLKMLPEEVQAVLNSMALMRNEGEHPSDLASVRLLVSKARQACGGGAQGPLPDLRAPLPGRVPGD